MLSKYDANSDGFADGLTAYLLMGSPSNPVDLMDNLGRRLSSETSRSWNALGCS